MADLSVNLAGLKLRNPTVLASGFMDETAESMIRCVEAGAGAVVTKSIGMKSRTGHPNPTVVEVEGGLLNAMGLPNPGIDKYAHDVEQAVKKGVVTIGSIFGGTNEEFAHLSKKMEQAGAHAIELNLSCPHAQGYGTDIGAEPALVRSVCKAVTDVVSVPVFAKLTPMVQKIDECALAAVAGGAHGITAINTMRGMSIDVDTHQPILGNRVGGLSGPAIRSIGVRCVYEIYAAFQQKGIKAPIMGVGGIESGRDAIEYILAGADAVQLGTVLVKQDYAAFGKVVGEMTEWMRKRGVKNLADLKGAAHRVARQLSAPV